MKVSAHHKLFGSTFDEEEMKLDFMHKRMMKGHKRIVKK